MGMTETLQQTETVNRLIKIGFRVTKQYPDGEISLCWRKRSALLLAEVAADGSINGEPAATYIHWAKNY